MAIHLRLMQRRDCEFEIFRSVEQHLELPVIHISLLITAAAHLQLCLARPAGFEPTTPWFVAKHSIQLSYGREPRIISNT
jgi:hypothetical protein